MKALQETGQSMPGWMVETACKYAKIAAIAWEYDRNLGLQAEVNAALAIEILLKSSLAKPVNNEYVGTIKTQYETTKREHDLHSLYLAIPKNLQLKLGCIVMNKRYDYEPDSKGISYDDTLLHIAARLIPKMVDYFIEQGSKDPWLLIYKKLPENFQLPTGVSIFR